MILIDSFDKVALGEKQKSGALYCEELLSKLTNSDDCPVNLIKIENGKDADL